MNVIVKGDNTEKTIPVKAKPNPTDNTIDLGGIFARYVRFDITAWSGDSPAIGQVIITDKSGKQLTPTGVDPDAAAKSGVLEFDVGQTVSARYTDDENETPGIPTIRESRRLGASYHNAAINVATRSESGAADKRTITFSPMWRLDLAAEPHVVVTDPDVDTTVNPDKLTLDVFTENGQQRTLELLESGPATGQFSATLPVTDNANAKEDARLLYVRPGDLVWFTYRDDRNMTPGYTTFRNANVLENRPTAGEFAPLAMLQTAWPFESMSEGASRDPSALDRAAADGRVTISLTDPDALSRAGKTVPVKTSALLSGTAQELTLSATSSGTASKTLDLILGDKDVDRALAGETGRGGATELSVAGDDLVRIAYADAKVATNDLQTRRTYTEDELKGQERLATLANGKPAVSQEVLNAVPIIKLRDPQRRLQADQDARLKDFRAEMNYRLAAYADEVKSLTARRDLLKSRQAAAAPAKPTTKPAAETDVNKLAADDALKALIAALDGQIASQEERIKRLTAMGAKPDRTRLDAPAAQSAIRNPQSAIPAARLTGCCWPASATNCARP
jgi:hypothetical protein